MPSGAASRRATRGSTRRRARTPAGCATSRWRAGSRNVRPSAPWAGARSMNDVPDCAPRERALDAGVSFIVQAPAGSGKTELLIQRFLALLARVERPERIVAMTFTRKAAGEMRERIVAALRDAACNARVMSHHEQKTRDLANSALAQDRRH